MGFFFVKPQELGYKHNLLSSLEGCKWLVYDVHHPLNLILLNHFRGENGLFFYNKKDELILSYPDKNIISKGHVKELEELDNFCTYMYGPVSIFVL